MLSQMFGNVDVDFLDLALQHLHQFDDPWENVYMGGMLTLTLTDLQAHELSATRTRA